MTFFLTGNGVNQVKPFVATYHDKIAVTFTFTL